jgi:hypothetical protein
MASFTPLLSSEMSGVDDPYSVREHRFLSQDRSD